MKFKEFTLDDFQEDSIKAINSGDSVMVSAPTGSGKTLIADYIIDKELQGDRRVIYTAPIKALSNQKFKDFCEEYGEERIGLITGDIVINSEAQVLIMTTEVYRNMAIIKDKMLDNVAYCIMDEIHFINDVERGIVWEESIIFSPDTVRFLFLSATVPNADEFASWVQKIKHHEVEVIKSDFRPVPLEIKFFDVDLGITTLDEIKKLSGIPEYGQVFRNRNKKKRRTPPPDFRNVIKEIANKLPCIYFVFSRAKTQDYAVRLSHNNDFLSGTEKSQVAKVIQEHLKRVSNDVLNLKSTLSLRQSLSKGIGFHHAGLLPDLKHIVEKLFASDLIKVLFATETFAVGINMPAKTVCFDSLRKYTGTGFRYLNSKEFFQISGRAGRRGMDKTGLSVSVIHRPSADFVRIANLSKADTMPITSRFKMSYNTVLNMVNQHNAEEIDKILHMNFYIFQQAKGIFQVKARYEKAVKVLKKMGYINEDELTELGTFTTKIYANELEISQLFMNSHIEFDEYKILLLIAAIAYEEKRDIRFYETFPSKAVSDLEYKLRSHEFLKRFDFHKNIKILTAIVQPMFDQKSFTDILKNSTMVEGDLMRLLMQMLDRLEQIDRALYDHEIQSMVRNCKHIIKDSLSGIGMF
jgi:superfamily II RNA helicase